MASVTNLNDTTQASTSGAGGLTCVAPLDNKDGSYTLPAPVASGTVYFLVRKGAVQRKFGTNAQYTLQGTQITLATPLQSDEWLEFYYTQGTPITNANTGGQVIQ
jgi:hypothetical protein